MYEKTIFRAAADRIKGLGYRVFSPKDNSSTYGFFSDGKRIGYFDTSTITGIHLGTCNAPGSSPRGISVKGSAFEGFPLESLTKEVCEEAFRDYPSWYRRKKSDKIIKYASLQDFLERYWNKDNLIEL